MSLGHLRSSQEPIRGRQEVEEYILLVGHIQAFVAEHIYTDHVHQI